MSLCRVLPLLLVLLAPIPVPGAAADGEITQTLLEFAAASCRGWEASGAPARTWGDGAFSNSDILFRGQRIGTRFRSQTGDDMRVELEVIAPGGRPTRFIGLLFNAFGDSFGFSPSIRQPSPSRTALVSMWVASEPWAVSVIAKAKLLRPSSRASTHSAFWASEP